MKTKAEDYLEIPFFEIDTDESHLNTRHMIEICRENVRHFGDNLLVGDDVSLPAVHEGQHKRVYAYVHSKTAGTIILVTMFTSGPWF